VILLRDVEVDGTRTDCRIADGVIVALEADLGPAPDDLVLDARGGALLPGLADHHLHLAATAAYDASLDLADLRAGRDLDDALADADPDQQGWIRAVGYDDVAHGDLDRHRLDRATGGVPVRVQHRSGALWVLNTAGLALLGAGDAGHPGIERDPDDHPTGRLWRADHWLGEALGTPAALSLRDLGARLASYGVTHVTDASPGSGHLPLLAAAVASGDLPQHVQVLARDAGDHLGLAVGPVKLVVGDHDLPHLDDLVAGIVAARTGGRAVSVHCVTRAGLALTVAALDAAGGAVDGDRIEHCAVAGADLIAAIAERGLRVVTQPSLVARRGASYAERSEAADLPDLWPYAGLLRAGVRVATSSDAPYGDPDPWATLRAAAGRTLNPGERVPAATALAGLLSAVGDPGGPVRRVAVGEPADLVLLDRGLDAALLDLDARCVRATIISGTVVHQA